MEVHADGSDDAAGVGEAAVQAICVVHAGRHIETVDLEVQKPRKLTAASARLCATLFDYLTDLHEYVDEALEIKGTLRARVMAMMSAQFERLLHPIFEEDDNILILSSGGLGFLAGLVQQLL